MLSDQEVKHILRPQIRVSGLKSARLHAARSFAVCRGVKWWCEGFRATVRLPGRFGRCDKQYLWHTRREGALHLPQAGPGRAEAEKGRLEKGEELIHWTDHRSPLS